MVRGLTTAEKALFSSFRSILFGDFHAGHSAGLSNIYWNTHP